MTRALRHRNVSLALVSGWSPMEGRFVSSRARRKRVAQVAFRVDKLAAHSLRCAFPIRAPAERPGKSGRREIIVSGPLPARRDVVSQLPGVRLARSCALLEGPGRVHLKWSAFPCDPSIVRTKTESVDCAFMRGRRPWEGCVGMDRIVNQGNVWAKLGSRGGAALLAQWIQTVTSEAFVH